jgi:uncharacterized membrane protein
MTFTTPLALLLLLTLIPIIYLGVPRAAYRRGRDLASLCLRAALIALLVLALAGAQISRAADQLAVVFLVDVSDSVGQAARPAQLAFMREALAAMQPEDQAAIVEFGGDALVERPMSALREIAVLRSTPISAATDLEEAIGLGLALFPSDAGKRMVILSDGQQTVGDALRAARRAAATDVQIDYILFERPPTPEVQLTDVRAPSIVGADQDFDLSITVESDAPTPATITVFASGAVIYRDEVDLRTGVNNYALTLNAGTTGFRDFQVRVTPAGDDGFDQNNRLAAFTRVEGAPRALLVTPRESALTGDAATDEARYLYDALIQQGLEVTLAAPNEIPAGLAALENYDAVILANVPASDLTPNRMRALQAYVRDLGGGLVVVGGPDSYAPGGYFETPLEAAIPLDMQIRDQQRVPQLTLAYVIDRSGSMSAVGQSGFENIELAKEAIIRSIDFLQPTDRAGVVSFDTDGYWVADVQPVLDRRGLQNLVGTLRASGGTDIEAGYILAGQALTQDDAPRKHIILLTDGGAPSGDLVELATQYYDEYGITTSVIAIGEQNSFLVEMTEVGGGQFHFVEVVETIPTIFTAETVLATRAYILEDSFVPNLAGVSPILAGIAEAPPLRGYVAATPKQTAQVILTGPAPYNDPILAQWQYGLGRAVAFTSDATARWAADWVGWEGFARFWSQAVRWTITEGTDELLEARIVDDGERARLIVDARAADGSFLNGLALTTALVDPDLEGVQLPLQQTAPGRYELTFTPQDEGAYFLRIAGVDTTGTEVRSRATGWVRSYSPEYTARRGDGAALLSEIAALTDGRSLLGEPAAAFDHTLAAQTGQTPLAFALLLAAALLLPLDIAVRRLLVTRSDIGRARAAVGAAIFARRESSGRSTATIETLRGAKARARQTLEVESVSDSPDSESPSAPQHTIAALRERRRTGEDVPPVPPSGGSDTPAPFVPPRESAAPPPDYPAAPAASSQKDDDNIAGRLLQKRKRP